MADQYQVAPQAGADPSDPHANTGSAMPTRDRLQRLAGLYIMSTSRRFNEAN